MDIHKMISFKGSVIFLFLILLIACKQKQEEAGTNNVGTELPYRSLPLDDLSEFTGDGTGWRIAGNVFMDRLVEHHLDAADGKGVLVFTGAEQADLLTDFDHGDLDLRLDFMVSKNSEVVLSFQGRYAIRLSDSWRKDSTSGKWCGAVMQGNGNEMTPLLNASKAPGLWQHLLVKFKAPRFDDSGKKISNAVFEEISMNGKIILKDVWVDEVTAESDGKKNGPLKITGGSGAVAFRNFGYKIYNDERIVLKDLQYSVYKGLYRKYDTLQTLSPVRTGSADSIHWKVGDKRAQLAFQGKMNIPAGGDYLFRLRAGGPAWLLIDDREVVNNRNTREYTHAFYGTQSLTKGEHLFKVFYANYDESLVIEYAGPGIPLTMLTAPASERKVETIEPLEYVANAQPALQRGFFTHRGKVNTHAISAGISGGMNYAYDLNTFNVLAVWRGRFIDVSNMWTSRGESQMEIPLGAPLELPGTPALLQLSSPKELWTDTVSADNNIYTGRGYRLGNDGLPVFFYSYKNVNVEDQLKPNDDHSGFLRSITIIFKQPEKDLYYLLGAGKKIEKLSHGRYSLDDKEYFIESVSADEKQLTIIETKDGRYELLLPLRGESGQSISFNYSIIW